jgi:hypothetical protein
MQMPTGDELHDAIERLAMTNNDFALLIGVHTMTIYKWRYAGEKRLAVRHGRELLIAVVLVGGDEKNAPKHGRVLTRLLFDSGVGVARAKLLEMGKRAA